MRQHDHILRYGYQPEKTLFENYLISEELFSQAKINRINDDKYAFIPIQVSSNHLIYLTSDAIQVSFANYSHFSCRYYPHRDICYFTSREHQSAWFNNRRIETRVDINSINMFQPFSHIRIEFFTSKDINEIYIPTIKARHKITKGLKLKEHDKVNLFVLTNYKTGDKLNLISKSDKNFVVIFNERGHKITTLETICSYLGQEIKKYVEPRQKHNTG